MNNYTKKIDTFLFRRSWSDLIMTLSDKDAGKVIKAIYLYTEGKETPLEDFESESVAAIYSLIIKQLNYSSKKFSEKIEGCNAERAARGKNNRTV